MANSTAADGAKRVFQAQIDAMLRRYASTIWLQSVPFLVMLVFGCSILVIAFFAAMLSLFMRESISNLKNSKNDD